MNTEEKVKSVLTTALPILTFAEHPEILRKPARPVERFDDELETFVFQLNASMQAVTWGNPVGMAANQIGDDRAVFIAEGVVYINPEIVWVTRAPQDIALEGCYSLEANKNFSVSRAPSIMVKWQDMKGNEYERRFNGFHARVIQHEMDHLLGKLCSDHD